MGFLQEHLLTLILFTPTLAAIAVTMLPSSRERLIRWAAFLASLIPLALSVWLWVAYDATAPGYQFIEKATWYEAIGASYHLGVDGISVPMVLLTTLLTPMSILISWSIKERVRAFMALFLLL